MNVRRNAQGLDAGNPVSGGPVSGGPVSGSPVSGLISGDDWHGHRLPAPLVMPALGLVGGIIVARWWEFPIVPILIAFLSVLLILIFASRRRWCSARWLGLLFLLLGVLLYESSMSRLPADHISRVMEAEPVLSVIRGRVVGAPLESKRSRGVFARWKPRVDVTTFDVDVSSIQYGGGEWSTVSGMVRTRVAEPVPELRAGHVVQLTGWLFRPQRLRNPGAFDSAAYLSARGILAQLKCTSRGAVLITEQSTPASTMNRIRQRARMLLRGDLTGGTEEEHSFLDAMVLGRRTVVDRDTNEKLIRIGCGHFLAASGMHVAVLASFSFWLGRLTGTGRWWSAWLMLAVVTAYALLAEPRPPILRATIGVYVFGGAMLLGRDVSSWNKLALAAVIILVWQPAALFDAGFQLSFVAVGGILLSAGQMNRWLLRFVIRRDPELERLQVPGPDARLAHRVRRKSMDIVVGLFAVSVCAWLWTLPFSAYHFQRVSGLGWLNSMLMGPVVTLTVVVGFLKVMVTAGVPEVGLWLTPVVSAASHWMSLLSSWLDEHIGGTFFVTAPSSASVLLIYAGMVTSQRRLWGKKRFLSAAGLVFAGALLWSWPRTDGRGADELRLTQLAVGRGTATVIEWPDGTAHLYDVGTNGSYDVGRSTVVPFLLHSGIRRVDRIWLSHANLDHFSGVLDVLDRIPCGPVVSTPYFDIDCGPDTPGETLLDELKSRGRVVEVANAPETMTFDSEATFEILWPPDHPPFELSANNSSLLARIEYRWYRILLCGDIEEAAQRWLMEHEDVDADVLVMPHHGSVRTNLSEFVTAVDPEYVVISGDRRRVRLSSSLLEMLDGREVFNTADDGAVRVSILEDDLSVRSWIGR